MLHSIFHSVEDTPVEEVQRDDTEIEEHLEDDTVAEEMSDDTSMEQELLGVENTDSTNIPLSIKTFFRCDECGKSFMTNKTLRRHIRNIHNRTPEPLPGRKSSFAKKSSDGRVFCSDCGVYFSANKNLLRHIRTSSTHRQRLEQKRMENEMKEATAPLLDSIHDFPQPSMIEYVTQTIKTELDTKEELPAADVSLDMKMMLPTDPVTQVATNYKTEFRKPDESSIENVEIDVTDENILESDPDNAGYNLRKNRNTSVEPEVTPSSKNTRDSVCLPVVTDVKRFPCQECGQQFTKKSNVYRHMRRVHKVNVQIPKLKEMVVPVAEQITIKKRFACDKCDSTYTKKCNLLRHSQNAHNRLPIAVSNGNCVKNIRCEYCVQLFARRSSLLRHMRRKHFTKNGASLAMPKIKMKFPNHSATTYGVEPSLLTDKNLRLTDYPFLRNMLPLKYDYNLKYYSLLSEKDIPYKCFVATVQFHCANVSETKHWVTLFEKANKITFKCVNAHAGINSKSQYRCTAKGCLAGLSVTTIGVNVQSQDVLRVSIRIVHKHNHKWDPPRLDLSQLVEAVIEEQDLIEECEDQSSSSVNGSGEQISIAPDSAYYTPVSAVQSGQQQPVMTLYFNKYNNSFVTQNVHVLGNDLSTPSSEIVLLDENNSEKVKGRGDESEYDALGQFKRVCSDMTAMIQQDPHYFAEAVQQFEASFDRICSSKCDLLKALREFGRNEDEFIEVSEVFES